MSGPLDIAWRLLKLEDPAAEGRPHSSFDLMNTSRPPEGVTEEDLAAFYQANPDIYHPSSAWTQERDEQGKPTGVAERPPLMRFPAYRKPVALGEELVHAEHYPVSVGSEGRYAHSPADYDKISRETGEHYFHNAYHHFPALQTRHEVLGTPGGTYNVKTGEPMDIAMRLLKLELAPPMTQGVEEQVPMQENIPTVDVDTMDGNDCCQKVKQAIVRHFEDIKKYPHNNSDDLDKQIKIIMNMSCEELQNQDYYSYWQEKVCSFNSDFQNVMTGEPMGLAFRLLKNIPLEDGGYRSTTSEDMTMEDAFDIGSGFIPYDELHSKQRQVADAILSSPTSYWNDPASGEFETENYAGMFHPETQHLYPDEAFDQYLRYLQHYFAASAETDKLPHEKQMEILHFDGVHPQHPSEIAELRMAQEYGEDWGSPTPHDDFYFRYNPETQTPTGPIATAGKRSLASRMARQKFLLRSEDAPFDMAFRLLKYSDEYNIKRNLLRDLMAQKYRERMAAEGTPENAWITMAGPPMYSGKMRPGQLAPPLPKRYDLKRWQRGYGHLLPEETIRQYADPSYRGPFVVPREMGVIPFDAPEWAELREQLGPAPVETGEPMDLAFRLLKDFYFGGASPQNMESGVFRPTWLPEGAAENRNLNPNLVQNQPNYFGANLSQQTQEEDPSQRRSAYQDEEGNWLSDEEIAQKLMGTLGHEQLHYAQDPTLREAYGMGEDPLQSEQFYDLMPAHEYGAISSTTPDMVEGALNYYAHPQLNYDPAKEMAASERYRDLASSPMPANITQGMRSQLNALRQQGLTDEQIQQMISQGMMPTDINQQMQQQQMQQQQMMQQPQMIQAGEPMDLAWRMLKQV